MKKLISFKTLTGMWWRCEIGCGKMGQDCKTKDCPIWLKLEQPDPQAEVALRRLNDKSDKIISTAAMEKAVIKKPKRKNNCPTYIGAKRRAK